MSTCITVTVAAAKGSTPREAGASMVIWADRQEGTIGGGALEWEATRVARQMLQTGDIQTRRSYLLGPNIGQCCGGAVDLDFILEQHAEEPTHPPLWVWGAGHVGRAIVSVLAPFPERLITWVDTAAARFPDDLPGRVSPLAAADPLRVVSRAPPDAAHLIVTYSHDLDLQLCDSLLHHGFSFAGLIGSATKWARFRNRLGTRGHADAQIARITCPIGDTSLGKHPQAIAIGVATQLMTLPTRADIRGETAI